ncbi:MAG: hypothetical protein OXJ90_03505 [Spirochaetaceae bacterium]|nr:hypothetical protein [Spirochaetaceae bacterium]
MIAEQGVPDTRITGPGYVLDQAVFHGVVSREEYKTLKEMLKYRNAIVHGFRLSDFRAELVVELIKSARRITADASDAEGEGQISSPS